MDSNSLPPLDIATPEPSPRRSPRFTRRLLAVVAIVAVVYAGIAYLVMPDFWKHYFRRHPALDDAPRITHTKVGLPGDPLNVGLVGTEKELQRIMLAAKWYPADPLTLRSCLKIAEGTVLDRPYRDAPVSNLYLWGRKEDLAFEQPVGDNPRKRHHVRFWRAPEDDEGRPFWIGAATYDDCVGLSHTTGQITHHIAADVDAERDHLIQTLQATSDLEAVDVVDDFHDDRQGKNGGGDPWHTDGSLYVGVIESELPKAPSD